MFSVTAVLACVIGIWSSSLASPGCTFRQGSCTYNIYLNHRSGPRPRLDSSDCDSKEQQVFLERAQNDYTAKIEDMERNLSLVRDKHEQRIKELENQVHGLVGNGNGHRSQTEDGPTEYTDLQSHLIFSSEPLTRRLEEEFQKLKDELRQKSAELIETNIRLNDTSAMVHEVQLQHFKTSQDLLNAENEITLLKRERAVLKNQLKDKIYRLDVSAQKASDCELKSSDLQEQMTKLFRSENTLMEELLTAQLKLNETKDNHEVLERKHASLKAKHERTRFTLKFREQELVDCFAAKTSTFCGFEDPKMCDFTNVNDSSDFFDWDRAKGGTPSAGTGPTADHTCNGPSGYFMFIEASAKGRGSNAILYSPLYRGLSEQCVEFYYHMYGRNIGTLNVYTQARGDVLNSAWRAYGNQGDVWTNARLAVPRDLAMAGYQIAFEGITENGYQGDIAIDDVSVRDGPCPVDEKIVPVHVNVNSTIIAKNVKAFARKLRKKQRGTIVP